MEFGWRGPPLVDLKKAISSLPRVFICLHPSDQCLPKRLPELPESLGDIIGESPRTRIFLTGSPYIREDVLRYSSRAVIIPISPIADDIRNFMDTRLGRDPESEVMHKDFRGDIARAILEKICE